MLFYLLRIELNEQDSVIAQTETQPLYELREDAMVMAEFEAARTHGDFGYNRERDCWWSCDANGRRYRFEVHAVKVAA
jgi:hypothetical protein